LNNAEEMIFLIELNLLNLISLISNEKKDEISKFLFKNILIRLGIFEDFKEMNSAG